MIFDDYELCDLLYLYETIIPISQRVNQSIQLTEEGYATSHS